MQLCEAFEPPQPLLEYQQAPLPYPDKLSPHWKALLLFLQTNEIGDDDDLD
ncbi:hypothetical protein [Pseudomonas sp. NKUCC02_KPG]|uniref:hypothetical protein n=1 Tax=Pseudomonas sp. NKUCC02_KPG TaxID=2842124 RepID=UPI001C5A6D75|nr:hypothetical protein [Pseudomonas sp. NKUCC02_KPG]MBW3505710.1 hypothetical protein [Pseudomonas sp. NKUCC02_KPG]